MQRGPVCLAESERVRFFYCWGTGESGRERLLWFSERWKWGLLFCELDDDRSVRIEKARNEEK